MKSIAARAIKLFLVAAAAGALAPQPARGDVESVLREINRKPAEERTKILVEGARKEGVADYYGSSSAADIQELLKGFNRTYPFVDVRYTRLGGPAAVSKVTTEYRAGVFNVDGAPRLTTTLRALGSFARRTLSGSGIRTRKVASLSMRVVP